MPLAVAEAATKRARIDPTLSRPTASMTSEAQPKQSADANPSIAHHSGKSVVLHVSWARRNGKLMSKQRLADLFAPFGTVEKVFMATSAKYALVTMSNGAEADAAIQTLHGNILPQLFSKRVFIKRSDFRSLEEKQAADAGLIDTEVTRDVVVPGLVVIPEFISKEEETALLNDIGKRPWHQTLQRRVQHYGEQPHFVCVPLLTKRTHAPNVARLPVQL